MSKDIGNNICKNLSTKYSQEFDHVKECAADVLETASKREIPEKAKATGDFIGNKIAHKITKYSKLSSQNSSETIETEIENGEFYRKIP